MCNMSLERNLRECCQVYRTHDVCGNAELLLIALFGVSVQSIDSLRKRKEGSRAGEGWKEGKG